MSRNWFFCLTTVLTGLLWLAAPAIGQPTGVELTKLAKQGEGIFREKCAGCHSIGAEDQPTGPGLAGVSERRERQWLIDFITNPDEMISAGDATAVALLAEYNNFKMPAVRLDPPAMEALLVFLTHLEEGAHHTAATPTTSQTANSARGADLFSGVLSLDKGGAPCLACHGIAGVGLAGSSNYGPDLTAVFENFGEDGLAGILQSLPFPSMEAIYANRPLTATEQLDLTAYFAQAAEQKTSPAKSLAGLILLGVIIVFAIVALFGLRRLRGVRRPLVEQARKQRGVM
jgi:mono/diheme cytochrome c family protein